MCGVVGCFGVWWGGVWCLQCGGVWCGIAWFGVLLGAGLVWLVVSGVVRSGVCVVRSNFRLILKFS